MLACWLACTTALAAPPVAPTLTGAPPGLQPLPAPLHLTIVALGDVIPHSRVVRRALAEAQAGDAASGWTALLQDLSEPLRTADLAFANLETPVAPRTGTGRRPYIFDAPPALPQALASLGIDVVSTANNHSWDQGIAGAGETVARVRRAGLEPVGSGTSCRAAWSPVITSVHGLRVGWLAFTRILNQHARPDAVDPAGPCIAYWSRRGDRRVADALDRLRPTVDVLVVSLHHGTEYQTVPGPRESAAVDLLVSHGADVILGHHPHVLQPLQVRTRPGGEVVVAHSLGNTLSNQGWRWRHGDEISGGDVRDGVLLRLTLAVTPGLPGVDVEGIDALPLWSDNDAEGVRDADTPLRVRIGDDVPAARRARIADVLAGDDR